MDMDKNIKQIIFYYLFQSTKTELLHQTYIIREMLDRPNPWNYDTKGFITYDRNPITKRRFWFPWISDSFK